MIDIIKLVFGFVVGHDLGRAIACLSAGWVMTQYVFDSSGISTDLARGLGIAIIICCVIAALSLIHYFFDGSGLIAPVLGIVFCIVLVSSACNILQAVNEYEADYNTYVQQQTRQVQQVGGRLSFGSRTVQCTECRGLKVCSKCDGSCFVTSGGIQMRCLACSKDPGKCRMCEGTGRKKY